MDGLEMTEAWLRLNALEFSAARARMLLEAFDHNPAALFAANETEWRERVPGLTDKRYARLPEIKRLRFEKDLAALERVGARVVLDTDACYPSNLRELPDAPPVLIVRGQLVPEDKFSVAVVGSRRASEYGLSLARRFARDLDCR
jgi:predicted Rossmann fold nucleotide-binding protein DprA/Smf involved in DNA uptake